MEDQMFLKSLITKIIISLAGTTSPAAVDIILSHFETPTPEQQAVFAAHDQVRGAMFATHVNFVADVPIEFGWHLWDASAEYGLDPLDLAAVMISEESGPDRDFSQEGKQRRRYTFDYETDDVGAAGEVGLFQVVPRWAKKAGYEVDDRFDPRKSAFIGAYTVRAAHTSHEDCEARRYNYHTWIAHYKCARVDRDDFEGFCRFKQNKWWQLRTSLDSVQSPDFKAIKKSQDAVLKKVQRRALRDWKREQKRAARRQAKEAGKKNLKAESDKPSLL
jgi:hypothetical protein